MQSSVRVITAAAVAASLLGGLVVGRLSGGLGGAASLS